MDDAWNDGNSWINDLDKLFYFGDTRRRGHRSNLHLLDRSALPETENVELPLGFSEELEDTDCQNVEPDHDLIRNSVRMAFQPEAYRNDVIEQFVNHRLQTLRTPADSASPDDMNNRGDCAVPPLLHPKPGEQLQDKATESKKESILCNTTLNPHVPEFTPRSMQITELPSNTLPKNNRRVNVALDRFLQPNTNETEKVKSKPCCIVPANPINSDKCSHTNKDIKQEINLKPLKMSPRKNIEYKENSFNKITQVMNPESKCLSWLLSNTAKVNSVVKHVEPEPLNFNDEAFALKPKKITKKKDEEPVDDFSDRSQLSTTDSLSEIGLEGIYKMLYEKRLKNTNSKRNTVPLSNFDDNCYNIDKKRPEKTALLSQLSLSNPNDSCYNTNEEIQEGAMPFSQASMANPNDDFYNTNEEIEEEAASFSQASMANPNDDFYNTNEKIEEEAASFSQASMANPNDDFYNTNEEIEEEAASFSQASMANPNDDFYNTNEEIEEEAASFSQASMANPNDDFYNTNEEIEEEAASFSQASMANPNDDFYNTNEEIEEVASASQRPLTNIYPETPTVLSLSSSPTLCYDEEPVYTENDEDLNAQIDDMIFQRLYKQRKQREGNRLLNVTELETNTIWAAVAKKLEQKGSNN